MSYASWERERFRITVWRRAARAALALAVNLRSRWRALLREFFAWYDITL